MTYIKREKVCGDMQTLWMVEFWDWLVSACLLWSVTDMWQGRGLPRKYGHLTLTINSRWWNPCFFWCGSEPFKISTL